MIYGTDAEELTQSDLRNVYDALDTTPVFAVLDEETAEWIERGQYKEINGAGILYVDDHDGFRFIRNDQGADFVRARAIPIEEVA